MTHYPLSKIDKVKLKPHGKYHSMRKEAKEPSSSRITIPDDAELCDIWLMVDTS
jgi:hypothetical protein